MGDKTRSTRGKKKEERNVRRKRQLVSGIPSNRCYWISQPHQATKKEMVKRKKKRKRKKGTTLKKGTLVTRKWK